MGPGRKAGAWALPGAGCMAEASPLASPVSDSTLNQRPSQLQRPVSKCVALGSLSVQFSVLLGGGGPRVSGKFSVAAAAQRVSDTPWKEARSGLVKHDLLAESLFFPSFSARLLLLPVWHSGLLMSFLSPVQRVMNLAQHLHITRFHLKVRLAHSEQAGGTGPAGAELWPALWVGRLCPNPHHKLLSQALMGFTHFVACQAFAGRLCDISHVCARTHEASGMGCTHRAAKGAGSPATGHLWKWAVALSLLRAFCGSQLPQGKSTLLCLAHSLSGAFPTSCHSILSDLHTLLRPVCTRDCVAPESSWWSGRRWSRQQGRDQVRVEVQKKCLQPCRDWMVGDQDGRGGPGRELL